MLGEASTRATKRQNEWCRREERREEWRRHERERTFEKVRQRTRSWFSRGAGERVVREAERETSRRHHVLGVRSARGSCIFWSHLAFNKVQKYLDITLKWHLVLAECLIVFVKKVSDKREKIISLYRYI